MIRTRVVVMWIGACCWKVCRVLDPDSDVLVKFLSIRLEFSVVWNEKIHTEGFIPLVLLFLSNLI